MIIQNCFIFFDRNSCLTFKLSTACSATINRFTECYNQTRLQSRKEQGDKKEKLTESLHLTVKISKKVEL